MAVLAGLLESPYLAQSICAALLGVFIFGFWRDFIDELPYSRVPLVGKKWWSLSNKKAKARFTNAARALLAEGFAKGISVFQVVGGTQPLIVLDPKYIDEIKSHPHLDFQRATTKNFFDDRIAGFEAFHPKGSKAGQITVDLVRVKLTQALGSLTIPLSKETAATVEDIFPTSNEWKTYNFSHEIPYILARLSSLAFLGEHICRDKDWVNVSVHYTLDAFAAARELRMWPSTLRPFVHWFMPSVRKLRQHMVVARSIINREIEKRALIREGKLAPEDPPRSHADALDWLQEMSAEGNTLCDISRSQVGLALAAIHTTSNLMTNVIYDLAAYPEYIQPLRDEIRTVIAEDGVLKKTSLLKLKLMDSVMKESQRINPVSITSLNRFAVKAIPLSDGTVIPQGAIIAVSAHVNEDNSIYPNAATYDGFRFYKKRQEPGHEHRHQLVTTTSESYNFGHGIHACPGRFFAVHEAKILLIHLLLKYDWMFKEDHGRPNSIEHGTEVITNPMIEIMFRYREPEIDLAALGEVNLGQ
ncbi:hypothetical protein N7462_011627 [Penicillium macrosclerotiorum]|uniref:uncharacterized protein n=1 Tax=Penicillium macrosclerotiorum TaxID=303699 RepID=UPI002548A352|nr:uncharacterized protein N7462_011627 [Penicillium macrosclerotiorum]KAJ5662701.1 hypothetical protein N7462_011627 [Penicillium macrosclerotiorum]